MKIYNATAYVRASNEDEDSNTIENQTDLIRDYAEKFPEIKIVSVREDNGFTGVDFSRPAYKEMMEDIKTGKTNCVIIKDLSRLGRNYIKLGELMDEVFPRYGVRLIAINDNYDSIKPRSDSDDILYPIKNVINEHYSRDISMKIRSSLEIKRKKGEYVQPFPSYGYKRDPNNKCRFIIDDHAAEVVRKIFRQKIEGLRTSEIANRLNAEGELSPAEYRRSLNKNYRYRKNILWSHTAVNDILINPVYTGALIHGKTTTQNYKIRKNIKNPEEEWHIIQNAHEPIISKIDFDVMQFVLKQRNQHIKSTETIHPLAGFLHCYDCGNRMVRATFTNSNTNEKRFAYVCASVSQKGVCSTHYIQEFYVENTVTEAITRQIDYVVDIKKKFEHIRTLPHDKINLLQTNVHLLNFEDEIKRCKDFKRTLFDDYQNGIISKDDYILFSEEYTIKLNELNKKTAECKEVTEMMINLDTSIDGYLDHFLQFKDFKEINRMLTANLLERIDVTKHKHLLIRFRFQDKFEMIKRIIDKLLEAN